MRSGVQRSKTVVALCGRTMDGESCNGGCSAGAYVPAATAWTSRRADIGGRADSRMGQSSTLLAEIVRVSPAG